jgi:hypothetical protein
METALREADHALWRAATARQNEAIGNWFFFGMVALFLVAQAAFNMLVPDPGSVSITAFRIVVAAMVGVGVVLVNRCTQPLRAVEPKDMNAAQAFLSSVPPADAETPGCSLCSERPG